MRMVEHRLEIVTGSQFPNALPASIPLERDIADLVRPQALIARL
jgi:hypothetical protein